MNAWLDWGIPIISWLQGLGSWLTTPMQIVTFLGTEEFFLVLMPAILWCVDVSLGYRLGLILIASSSLNGLLKLGFGAPRPYWVSDQVRALSSETSFGAPSGHAQTATALWGRLAAAIRRGWAVALLIVLIVLISISRLYLGVHFPTDTLAGWLVGGTLLFLFLRFEDPVARWMRSMSVTRQMATVLAASLVVLLLTLAVHGLTAGRPVPPEWAQRAAAAAPDADPIDPHSLEGLVSEAGLVLGIGFGGVMFFAWGGFRADGEWWKRVLRYIVGLVGVLALWAGLRLVFPSGDSLLAMSLRYLRYGAVGFWAAYLAPRVFVAMHLA
jgi:membrane-associated phospholipid phosphatase